MAKYLTDRQEIAKAINFGKYPVLTLNRQNDPLNDCCPDSDYSVGCRVRVAWDRKDKRYEGMATSGNIYIEDGKIAISNDACCLSSRFGYSDVIKMATEANTPIVHAGQTVVVVEDWPNNKVCTVRMMKISDRIDIHCMTVAHLEDIE